MVQALAWVAGQIKRLQHGHKPHSRPLGVWGWGGRHSISTGPLQDKNACPSGHCRTECKSGRRGRCKSHKAGKEMKNRREAWGSGVNTVDRKTEKRGKTWLRIKAEQKKVHLKARLGIGGQMA